MRDVVLFIRARLEEIESQAPALHRFGCPAGHDADRRCECGFSVQVLADVRARRDLVEEFVDWLESDTTSERERGRTRHALLLLAQPWSGRADFDPYWRVDV